MLLKLFSLSRSHFVYFLCRKNPILIRAGPIFTAPSHHFTRLDGTPLDSMLHAKYLELSVM